MKKQIITGIVIMLMTAASAIIGYNYGYKQPPYKVVFATTINSKEYAVELEDHEGYKFFLCITIEKAVAMGIDTVKIIELSNMQ